MTCPSRRLVSRLGGFPNPVACEKLARAARIRELNDVLRQTFSPGLGKVFFTRGILELSDAIRVKITQVVQCYDKFTEGSDPYGEHDFGAVTIDGNKCFWKIDYYDPTMTKGSENPTDSNQTRRVLTIMLASEY